MTRRPLRTLFTLALALTLAACGATAPLSPKGTGTTSKGDSPVPDKSVSFAQFTDIPVPAGAKMDIDQTLVLGSDNDWIGRLTLDTGLNVVEVYDFFKREMAEFGWHEVTSVRATISVLTYARDNRVATLQILGGRLKGTKVHVTVSPRGSAPQ